MSKQEIIRNIYFDKAGFGSKNTTLKDAREKNKSMTMKDVEDFFKKSVEIKMNPRGYNSFVAPHNYNNHRYQVDIFFLSKKDLKVKQRYRAGLVCIDCLSKYAVVVPVRRKVTGSVIQGTKKAIEKMGKKPEIIYTDDEKAVASGEFQAYVESEGIELYRTRGHPAFAERFIKTFKDKLCKRVENDEKNLKTNIQRIDYIDEIMLTYNNKDVHSATGQTPYKARDKDNEFNSRLNISNESKETEALS